MKAQRSALPTLSRMAAMALFATMALAPSIRADPVLGFVEDWSGTSLHNWAGGAGTVQYSNPGTGGVGGAGDGFLLVNCPVPFHLGTKSLGSEFTGDWLAAGVTRVRFWLNDVNTDENLEIHVAIGNSGNFWQSNQGFSPPEHGWQEFHVNLLNESDFTRIHGTGTFAEAVMAVSSLLFRHDRLPFDVAAGNPVSIQGDFGLDRVQLVSATVPTLPTSWARLKALYR